MLAKDIEAKIVAAITEAMPTGAPAHQIFGAWQNSASGVVRNRESSSSVGYVSVCLGTMSRQTYTAPTASFKGSVALVVRLDLDPTGTAAATFADPIENLFAGWQAATYQSGLSALSVTGFTAADIIVDGGAAPVIDFASHTLTVTWGFTVSGVTA